MSALGHEQKLHCPWLYVCFEFSKPTFAYACGGDRCAPKADLCPSSAKLSADSDSYCPSSATASLTQ